MLLLSAPGRDPLSAVIHTREITLYDTL